MRLSPTPIGDHLDLVVCGEAHRSHDGRHPGGEWDPWNALTKVQRKRLIGARFARSGALEPDALADLIVRNHPNLTGDPLVWFFRTALLAIDERQHARNRDRHQRLAEAHGFVTYYRYRNWMCHEAGFGSLWGYRRERGWE